MLGLFGKGHLFVCFGDMLPFLYGNPRTAAVFLGLGVTEKTVIRKLLRNSILKKITLSRAPRSSSGLLGHSPPTRLCTGTISTHPQSPSWQKGLSSSCCTCLSCRSPGHGVARICRAWGSLGFIWYWDYKVTVLTPAELPAGLVCLVLQHRVQGKGQEFGLKVEKCCG